VVPSHLADNSQFDFVGLKTQSTPFENGDIGFDPPEMTTLDKATLDTTALDTTALDKTVPLTLTNN
jgi:tRNA 2-thiocytidine biosynthesis protein TtcA